VRAVELEREPVELLERAVVVGVLPRRAESRLDRLAVALGEMVERVLLLVLDAALYGHVVAEHPADGFPKRLRSVDDEQQALLDIEPTVDEIGQQR
jgi:hypothetical protein